MIQRPEHRPEEGTAVPPEAILWKLSADAKQALVGPRVVLGSDIWRYQDIFVSRLAFGGQCKGRDIDVTTVNSDLPSQCRRCDRRVVSTGNGVRSMQQGYQLHPRP
jgi:hypothetical protein